MRNAAILFSPSSCNQEYQGRLQVAVQKSKPDGPLDVACSILGGKWIPQILQQLQAGPLRFNQLRKRLPWIPTKSLALVLQKLEERGVVQRSINSARPPHVAYSMAEEDLLLPQIIELLSRWGSQKKKQFGAHPKGSATPGS